MPGCRGDRPAGEGRPSQTPRLITLPGNLTYEPKWNGYRFICIRDDNGATLWSRQGKDRHFPHLVAAIAAAVPPGCVIDGDVRRMSVTKALHSSWLVSCCGRCLL